MAESRTLWPEGPAGDPKRFFLFLCLLLRKEREEQKGAKSPFKLRASISLSTPTPTISRRQNDPCDPARLLAELPNERTTSGNFLPMATLPASRPSPPPGWVLPGRRSHCGSRRPAPGTGCKRSAAASAGAGCLSEGAQGSGGGGAVSITVRVSLESKFSSLLTLQAAPGRAEPPFSAPRSSRPIRRFRGYLPGGFGAGLALSSAPLWLANFAGPAARRAAPCAHVCASCGWRWMPGSGARLGGQGSS